MDVHNQTTLNMGLKSLRDWDAKVGDVFGANGVIKFTVDSANQEYVTGLTEWSDGSSTQDDNWSIDGLAWHLISRATPTVDLTTITTPFGLLDDDTQKALREYDDVIEVWNGEKWVKRDCPSFVKSHTYRAKPTPPVKTFTQRVWLDDLQCYGTVTGQVQDGKLVGDAKVVIEGA